MIACQRERLQRTWCPAALRRLARCEPMKPAGHRSIEERNRGSIIASERMSNPDKTSLGACDAHDPEGTRGICRGDARLSQSQRRIRCGRSCASHVLRRCCCCSHRSYLHRRRIPSACCCEHRSTAQSKHCEAFALFDRSRLLFPALLCFPRSPCACTVAPSFTDPPLLTSIGV